MKPHFIIPGRLPGLNDMIAEARTHRMASAVQKKKWTNYCMQAFSLSPMGLFTPVTEAITLDIVWIEPNRKRDLDNIAAGTKYILDALVSLRILPNDTREWVHSISHEFPKPDPLGPRIEVSLL